ncbi:Fascin-like domain-containing protein [Pandoravirus kuranda]|uniref:Fascin-like domain-containing protein n=1 Tax=Pandoravirus kuranda TaxID=3019033 RepID=A0AA95ECZ9_9VIRU|nr:Fascin-like domain-containing protein [Pandoravirus kuranda]
MTTSITMASPAAKGRRPVVSLLLAVALCVSAAVPSDAYRYSVFVEASRTWTPPADATDITVSLWGGGGGASTTAFCGASGGSGAAVIGRNVGDACWPVLPHQVEFTITVGQGGAPWGYDFIGGVAGNGQPTTVSARLANGTELFYAVAYGGGGAKSAVQSDRRGCQGGGGGGATSSAVGPVPGGGNPTGGVDNNPTGPPTEGAMVGDVKAGGAGAGYGFIGGVTGTPYTDGADWSSPGRHWSGAHGSYNTACYAWGGAAGFNGNGGPAHSGTTPLNPAPNSGAGGGSALTCTTLDKFGLDDAGASGGAIIEYDLPYGPSPSATPSNTPTPPPTPPPSATPSITPSPSSIPSSLTFGLVWPPTGKYLSCAWGGAVSAVATSYNTGEVWYAQRASDGTYLVRCNDISRLLTAHEDGTFTADQIVPMATNFYSIERNPSGAWIIGTYYGKYIHANAAGEVFAGTEPAAWQKV